MPTNRNFPRAIAALALLGLLGLLAACSLPGRDPEIVVVQLPTSTGLPTPPQQEPLETCLVGNWVMPTERLDLLVTTLFPSTTSFMRILSGQLSMSFTTDGAYTYTGEYLMHVDSGPGQYSEAVATFSTAGTYSTLPEGRLVFEVGTSESHMVSCTAYNDGTLYTVPCDSAGMFSLLPPSEAPYRCSQNLLEIDVPAPSGMIITMFFDR